MNIVTMFSKSSDNENENDDSTNISMTQTLPKKETKGLSHFNDK